MWVVLPQLTSHGDPCKWTCRPRGAPGGDAGKALQSGWDAETWGREDWLFVNFMEGKQSASQWSLRASWRRLFVLKS